jgi:hypothetical protein
MKLKKNCNYMAEMPTGTPKVRSVTFIGLAGKGRVKVVDSKPSGRMYTVISRHRINEHFQTAPRQQELFA